MVTRGLNCHEYCCLIHHLSKNNYDILYKGPFSQTWSKAHKMLGMVLGTSFVDMEVVFFFFF